jgi:hypothetical protein
MEINTVKYYFMFPESFSARKATPNLCQSAANEKKLSHFYETAMDSMLHATPNIAQV